MEADKSGRVELVAGGRSDAAGPLRSRRGSEAYLTLIPSSDSVKSHSFLRGCARLPRITHLPWTGEGHQRESLVNHSIDAVAVLTFTVTLIDHLFLAFSWLPLMPRVCPQVV